MKSYKLFTPASVLFVMLFFVFVGKTIAQEHPSNWTLYKSIDGVEIFYKYSDCISTQGTDQERVILKFNNTNKYAVSIDWKTLIWYNNVCHNCDNADPEFDLSIKLLKQTSVEGNCEERSSNLSFYSDFLDYQAKQKLSNFELSNLVIKKLNSTK